ncbi:hypothetical protein PCANB_002370 [Pneumocystis canis]|nr:hypothetical protein PCANB_002370 [Pneumocystis canis]
MNMYKERVELTTSDFLSTFITNISYLISFQFFSRLITFILNQMILRFTIPEVFGFAMIRVELIISTILFLSREGFRVALQRHDIFKQSDRKNTTNNKQTLISDDSENGLYQRLVNLSYIPIFISIITSILFFFSYVRAADNFIKKQPVFKEAIFLYAFSTIIEIFVEPLFVLVQQNFLYKIRVISETLALFLKCCITFSLTYWINMNWNIEDYGVLPFALGQLGYSIVLFISYFTLLSSNLQNKLCFFPKKIYSSSDKRLYFFHRPTLILAITVTVQSLFKHILTEGDRLLVAWFMTDLEQGIYALVINYGSLIARLVFSPVEELSRNFFSKLCLKMNKDNYLLARNILFIVIKLYIIFGIFVITFGPLYCSIFIRFVVGLKWNEAQVFSILKFYIFYIPVMAINGITEAFVQAIATPNDIKKQSYWMFFFSGLFMFIGYILLGYFKFGMNVLVLIDIINLGARAIWCLVYIRHYFKRFVVQLILPSKTFFFFAVFIAYFMQSKIHSVATLSDILIGIIMAGLLFCIWREAPKGNLTTNSTGSCE